MLTLLIMYLLIFMYFSGVWIYCSKRKHLLIMLLMLEYLVVCTFMLFLIYLGYLDFGMYFSMIYLVFSVCEGALGLGILVSVVRFYGNDYLQSYLILRC